MDEAQNLDLYNCGICMENMLERYPRMLSCHHSFCSECLKRLTKRDAIECPSCRSKTDVPNNDVSKLQVNFTLLKVKEHYDKLLASKAALCQLCKTTNAAVKCQECAQLLCENCRQKHNKLKTFRDHHHYKLCPEHPEGMVVHICVRCVKPVCSTCIIIEHSEHEGDLKPFTKGKNELLSEIKKFKAKLKEKDELNQKLIKQEEENVKAINKAKQSLNEQIEYHSKKLKDAKANLKRLNTFDEEHTKIIKENKKSQEELKRTGRHLVNLTHQIQNEEFCGYQFRKKKVKTLISREMKVPRIPKNISVHDPTSGEVLKLSDFLKQGSIPKKVTFMENPELVKKIPCPDQGDWGRPWNISVFDENSVIITDCSDFFGKGRNTVTIAHQTDKPTIKVPVPTGYGNIKDNVVFGDYMYFVFRDCIIQKPKSGGDQELMFKPAVNDIRRCVVVSESCFVLVCDRQLHVFDSNTRITRKVVDNLKDPKSIRLGYPGGKKTFAIADSGMHEVYLYDEAWNKLHTLGGRGSNDEQFNQPCDTAFTPNGLIVADAGNLRLSLFDFDGKFVKHLMVKFNGYPDGIVFNYPYMWVVENVPVLLLTVSLWLMPVISD